MLALTLLVLLAGMGGALLLGAAIGALVVAPLFLVNALKWRRVSAVLGPDVVRCVAYAPDARFGYLVVRDAQLSLHGMDLETVGSWPLQGLVVTPGVLISPPRSARPRTGFRLNAEPPVDLVCMGRSGWITKAQSDEYVRALGARGVSVQAAGGGLA